MTQKELSLAFEQLCAGDEEAFAVIYHNLKQTVYALAYRIVSSKEEAEDITQDVFVKLCVSPPPSPVKNPKALVVRMARNRSIDVLRKRKDAVVEETFLQNLPDTDPFQRLDLETAVAALPEEEREILALHLNGGLGVGEIAKLTGLTLSSVYRRYRKALNTLRKWLSGGAL